MTAQDIQRFEVGKIYATEAGMAYMVMNRVGGMVEFRAWTPKAGANGRTFTVQARVAGNIEHAVLYSVKGRINMDVEIKSEFGAVPAKKSIKRW